MPTAFEKAAEWVRKEVSSGKSLAALQTSMPDFRDGTYVVNRIISLEPLMLGYFDNKLKLEINDAVVRVASRVGKMHGLEAVLVPPDIHLVRENELVGIVKSNGFASTDSRLFEDIAREIFGIGGTPIRAINIKDRWLDSISMLISDKRLVETLFFAVLFILLPPTLAAYSLAITPSLTVPDPIRFAVAALIALSAIYVARLYVRENLKQASR